MTLSDAKSSTASPWDRNIHKPDSAILLRQAHVVSTSYIRDTKSKPGTVAAITNEVEDAIHSDMILTLQLILKIISRKYLVRNSSLPPIPAQAVPLRLLQTAISLYSSSLISTTVSFHLRAGTRRWNKMSISRKDLCFISGTQIQAMTVQIKAVPAQM